jgi:hypothetical protein
VLKLIALALAAGLLVSPALAKNTTITAKPEGAQCLQAPEFEELAKESGVIVKEVVKDTALDRFKAVVAKREIKFSDDVDELRLYDRSALHLSPMFATFAKGCVKGIGSIDGPALKEFEGDKI